MWAESREGVCESCPSNPSDCFSGQLSAAGAADCAFYCVLRAATSEIIAPPAAPTAAPPTVALTTTPTSIPVDDSTTSPTIAFPSAAAPTTAVLTTAPTATSYNNDLIASPTTVSPTAAPTTTAPTIVPAANDTAGLVTSVMDMAPTDSPSAPTSVNAMASTPVGWREGGSGEPQAAHKAHQWSVASGVLAGISLCASGGLVRGALKRVRLQKRVATRYEHLGKLLAKLEHHDAGAEEASDLEKADALGKAALHHDEAVEGRITSSGGGGRRRQQVAGWAGGSASVAEEVELVELLGAAPPITQCQIVLKTEIMQDMRCARADTDTAMHAPKSSLQCESSK
mmetsp:Transcript_4655/g.9471  ORF Transcript_4655/g.9471 Transcript_4655/m.9471 type:complete len:341 (-) Transcript_4655:494-1516(-)